VSIIKVLKIPTGVKLLAAVTEKTASYTDKQLSEKLVFKQ
jgi:hypothetical protein